MIETEGLRLDTPNSVGLTPLPVAIEYPITQRHHEVPDEVILALMNKGANINIPAQHRNTPLHLAAQNRRMSPVVISAMLKSPNGVHVNLRNKDEDTARHLEVEDGNTETVN